MLALISPYRKALHCSWAFNSRWLSISFFQRAVKHDITTFHPLRRLLQTNFWKPRLFGMRCSSLFLFGFIAHSISFAQLVPRRSDPIPQRWDWRTGSVGSLTRFAKKNNLRPVDIAVLTEKPLTFAAVFGDNTGELEVQWFFYGRLKRDRNAPIISTETEGRFTYLIAYGENRPRFGKLYAGLSVERNGENIFSFRCLSCTESSVRNRNKSKSNEVLSLSSFVTGSDRDYVLAGLLLPDSQKELRRKNTVVVRSSEEDIRKSIKSKDSIIVDLHRHDDGLYSAVLQELEKPVDFWWLTGVVPERVKEEAMIRNARVFDLEVYMQGKKMVFDVLMIQN